MTDTELLNAIRQIVREELEARFGPPPPATDPKLQRRVLDWLQEKAPSVRLTNCIRGQRVKVREQTMEELVDRFLLPRSNPRSLWGERGIGLAVVRELFDLLKEDDLLPDSAIRP